jgi:protein PET100
MAGPNLEVFKFGLYLFVPMFALLHFGDPDWYHNHVLPVGLELGFPVYELLD